MGLLSSMMGSAAGADVEKVTKQVEPFLLDDEKIDSEIFLRINTYALIELPK